MACSSLRIVLSVLSLYPQHFPMVQHICKWFQETNDMMAHGFENYLLSQTNYTSSPGLGPLCSVIHDHQAAARMVTPVTANSNPREDSPWEFTLGQGGAAWYCLHSPRGRCNHTGTFPQTIPLRTHCPHTAHTYFTQAEIAF